MQSCCGIVEKRVRKKTLDADSVLLYGGREYDAREANALGRSAWDETLGCIWD